MKALLQVVKNCTLDVDEKFFSKIDFGLLVYLGIAKTDTQKEIDYIKEKVLNLRIFEDECGIMNLSILDKFADLMLVSQFTLYGSTKKGRRPSYDLAMPPSDAKLVFEKTLITFKQSKLRRVESGVFGANMQITYTNLEPRTFIVESR